MIGFKNQSVWKSSWVACGAGVAFLLAVFIGGKSLLYFSESLRLDGGGDVSAAKRYVRPVAEGLKMSQHGMYGVDLVSCGSCLIEKRRHGPLSFGGSNVLVMEDLSVTLPPNAKKGTAFVDATGPRKIVQRLGVTKNFLSSQNIPMKFSGLRIRKLGVKRLAPDGKTVTPLFAAREAESSNLGLNLRDCAVTLPSGEVKNVAKATLAVKDDSMRLVWHDGEMKL